MAKAKTIKEQNYTIEFVDRVLDPVHGFIDLTQVEKEIVELPIFRRLRSLKQLSLANWVFPGAEHTRYMHSLGVMYIADLMALNLRDEDGRIAFNDGQRQLLRLAGLLHDIGHYPLSHVTEYVYNNNLFEEEDSLLAHNQKVKESIDKLGETKSTPSDYMKSRRSKPWHHETMGTLVIQSDKDIERIIKTYCPFINIEDINDIIVGCVDRNPNISAMVQLIHSELDADGIDYVMRDATFSGTSYGGFELGLLLRNLVVKKYEGVDIVGIRPKGISVVDQYLIGKYFSYTQVIFNKHVTIYGHMAETLTKHLVTLDKPIYPSRKTVIDHIKMHSKNDNYLRFTDRAFWAQIDNLNESDLCGYVPSHVVLIHQRLSHYQEFNTSDDGEFIITSNNRQEAYQKLTASPIYSRLSNQDEKHLMIFQSREFTSEVPEQKFRDTLMGLSSKKSDNFDEEAFEKTFVVENIARLQEGVPIIERGCPPRLLVDDPRSMMSYLYDTQTYILREYVME